MIDELIRQLRDYDPATRRRAIVALGKSKDAGVLPALANVVKNDPDPELRALARKAGQYIRRESQKQTQVRPGTNPLPNTSDLLTKAPPPQPSQLSKPLPASEAAPPPPPAPASRLRLLGEDNDTPAKAPQTNDETAPLPNTADLRPKAPLKPLSSKTPPAPPPPTTPPAPASRLRLLASDEPAKADKPASDLSRFQRPQPSEPMLDNLGADDMDDVDEPPDESIYAPRGDVYEPPLDLYDRLATADRAPEPVPEPDPDLFGEPPLNLGSDDEPNLLPGEPSAPPKNPLIVKGREYNVAKDDKIRAKQYLDAAMSLNMSGDNAKAMKNLTQALSLNPNLINDGFFNNVAATVTGLDGDEAAQMIIDRQERKRFTESAVREQKDRRVEKHLTTAKQVTSTDVWWEVGLYSLIVIFGPVVVMLVATESAKNLLNNFAQASRDLPSGLRDATIFSSFTPATLLPIVIVSGISGVVSLLIQTVLIHYSAKALGGTGTWSNLVQVLLGFYNKWLPVVFVVLSIAIFFSFLSLFSPIALCGVIILVILTLYVSSKTSSKIGEAYDFGMAQGCMALLISLMVLLILNAAISFVMAQALGFAFSQFIG